LYGFLQFCPEDDWVIARLLVLCRAEEVDDPAGIEAVPQQGVAHLTFGIRSESIQDEACLLNSHSPSEPAFRC
jgi:hypothetical protein